MQNKELERVKTCTKAPDEDHVGTNKNPLDCEILGRHGGTNVVKVFCECFLIALFFF